MKYIYIVKYIPNCEEDYIMYLSFSKEECYKFINRVKEHFYECDFPSENDSFEIYDFQAEDMIIKKLFIDQALDYE